MPRTPDPGLRLWPDAAQRYSPELFEEWRIARSRIPPKERQGPEWDPIDFGPPQPIAPNLAHPYSLTLPGVVAAQKRAALKRANFDRLRAAAQKILAAEREAYQWAVQDIVGQCKSTDGDLVAIGAHFEKGKFVRFGIVDPRDLWPYWRGGIGERIGFYDVVAKYEVRELRVYRREDAVRLFPELFSDAERAAVATAPSAAPAVVASGSTSASEPLLGKPARRVKLVYDSETAKGWPSRRAQEAIDLALKQAVEREDVEAIKLLTIHPQSSLLYATWHEAQAVHRLAARGVSVAETLLKLQKLRKEF